MTAGTQQTSLAEYRAVVMVHSPDGDRYHEIGVGGQPTCGETADAEWDVVPIRLAKSRWLDPCRRRPCMEARGVLA